MKMIHSCRFLFAVILTTASLILPAPVQSAEESSDASGISLESIAPENAESVLAKLTDEQIRNLLVDELQKKSSGQTTEKIPEVSFLTFFSNWLHLVDVDNSGEIESRLAKISNHTADIPTDLAQIIYRFKEDSKDSSLLMNAVIMFLVFLLAFAVEKLFNTATAGFHRQLLEQAIPQLSGFLRFWTGILRILPALTSLMVLVGSAFLIFILSPLDTKETFRLLFMAFLLVVIFGRIVPMFCRLFLAPDQPSLRLLGISDAAARRFQRFIKISLYFVGGSLTLITLFKELGLDNESLVLLVISLGTLFLLLLAFYVMHNRQVVADNILSDQSISDEGGWMIQQFAAMWHILALFYLFVIWLNFLYMQIYGLNQEKGALLLSLLAVPLFLLVNHIGHWVVQTTIGALHIYSIDTKEEETALSDPDTVSPAEKERLLIVRIGRIVSFTILCAVTIWVLSLWNYQLPYAAAIARAVFESLVTLALALFFWRIASEYIQRKIEETTPATPVEEPDGDSEWAAGAAAIHCSP